MLWLNYRVSNITRQGIPDRIRSSTAKRWSSKSLGVWNAGVRGRAGLSWWSVHNYEEYRIDKQGLYQRKRNNREYQTAYQTRAVSVRKESQRSTRQINKGCIREKWITVSDRLSNKSCISEKEVTKKYQTDKQGLYQRKMNDSIRPLIKQELYQWERNHKEAPDR